MSAARATNQKQTVDTFIAAWKRLSIEGMIAVRTPDCVQQALPTDTLKWPDFSNEQFAAVVGPQMAELSNFNATILSVTHDTDSGRSVVHSKTAADAPWGDYRNEHIMILTFNEDGTKITKLQDMVDSAEMMKRMAMIQEAASKQK